MRLSLDLELSKHTGELLAAGWVLETAGEVTTGTGRLPEVLAQLRGLEAAGGTLVGQNIRGFDLPHLWQLSRGRPSAEASAEAHARWSEVYSGAVLDTLELSPLLWPGKPKHALEKLYRQQTATNDPVADARETLERLQEAEAYLEQHPPRPALAYWWDKLLPLGALRDFLLGDGEATSMLEAATDLGDFDGEMMQRLWVHLENLPQHQPENLGALVALHWLLTKQHASHRRPAWVEHGWPTFAAAEAAALGQPDFSEAALTAELREIYGPDWSFRSGQLELVQALLGGQALPLGLLPTGGGKSLTFQFPALYLSRRERALSVVMSPLVALMEDQVLSLQAALPEYAERVAYLSGTQTPDDQRDILAGVWEGRIDLLYLSPERLRNVGVQKILKARRPALWVLDEAHTLSQWGIDFRPDFLRVAPLLAQIHEGGPAPLLGLVTATATARVLDDIQTHLVEPLAQTLGGRLLLRLPSVQPSPWRGNIDIQMVQMPKEERLAAARADLLNHAGEGRVAIVYVRSRKLAREYAESLAEGGQLRTAAFHAKLLPTEKRDILHRFKAGELDVVVATSAFGMGIDRAGIHTVLHMSPPNTAESYLQEIGRVARKQGERGRALLYWDRGDFATSLRFDGASRIGKDGLKKCWDEARRCLKRPPEQRWLSSASFEKPLGLVGEELLTQTRVALRALETYGLLQEGQGQPAALELRLHEQKEGGELGAEGRKLARWVAASQGWQAGASLTLDIMESSLLSALKPAEVLQGARQLVAAGWAEWSYRVTVRFRKKPKSLDNVATSVRALLAQWQEQDDLDLSNVNPENVGRDLQNRHKKATFEDARLGLRVLGLAHSRKDGPRWSFSLQDGAPPLTEWEGYSAGRFDELRRVREELQNRQQDKDDTITLNMAELELLVGALSDFGPQESLLALEGLGIIDLARADEAAAHIFRLDWGRRGQGATYNKVAFTPLGAHYDDRTRRIHVMRLLLEQPAENRQRFIEDYFALPLPDFCQQYAPDQADEFTVAQLPGTRARILEGLSGVQRQVVEDTSSRALLVLAGPGSGKTRVVVHRAAALLALENVPPEQILILAYNRTAVAEVRERLGALLSPLGLSYRPKVLTFHGLARELTGLKAGDALTAAGQPITNPDAQNTWLLGQLIQYLQENEVAYRYILVDEYQDIDEQKYQIIRLLTEFEAAETQTGSEADEEDQGEQKSYLVAVGDDDQNIYGFQGANIRYIHQFRQDYQLSPAQDLYLTDNYRSSPEIVSLSNAFIAASLAPEGRLKGPERAIVSRVTEAGKVGFCHYAGTAHGRYAAAHTIAHKIRELHAGGIALHVQAVLAPTWDDLHATEHALRELGLASQPLNNADHLHPAESLLGQHLLGQLEAAPSTLCADPAATLRQLCAPYSPLDRSFGALLASLHGLQDTTFEVMATRLRGAKPLRRDAVALSTFHTAKGSEFEQVFVLDTGKDARHPDPSKREDATRTLYVALTRARRGLFVLSQKGGGHPTFTPDWVKVHFNISEIREAASPATFPKTLRYTLELSPSDLYLSHRQLISAAGRQAVEAYARNWGPLHLSGNWIKAGAATLAVLSAGQRQELATLLDRGVQVLSVRAVQVFYCERDDLWYEKGGYAGPERGHYLLLPSFEMQRPLEALR